MGSGSIGALSSAIDTDFYLKMLIAELQNQDPEAPMDSTDMVTQMSQLATVDGMNKLSIGFSEMLALQRLFGGVDLVGRQVEYMQNGVSYQGAVESMRIDGDSLTLLVGGNEIGLGDVTKVL